MVPQVDYVELQLPGPNQPIFERCRGKGEEVIGVNHITFRVDNVQTAYQGLNSRGLRFAREPHYIRQTGRTIANGPDPDGWCFQLVDAKRQAAAG